MKFALNLMLPFLLGIALLGAQNGRLIYVPPTRSFHVQKATGSYGTVQGGYALGLTATQQTYHLGDPIALDVRLANISGPLHGFNFLQTTEAYRLAVTDANTGRLIPERRVIRGNGILDATASGYPLGQGEAWWQTLNLETFVDITQPGNYRVVASTVGVYDVDSHAGIHLTSNEITIHIIK